MADYNQTTTVTTLINSTQAKDALREMKTATQQLRSEIKKAMEAGDVSKQKSLQKELQNTNKAIRVVEASMFDINKVMNDLSGSSVNNLKKALRKMTTELNGMQRGTKEFDALQKKIEAVKKELAKTQEGVKSFGSSFGKMTDKFNRFSAIGLSVIAGITGVSYTFRKLSEDVAKMDDTYSDVMKTTGMTRDEVLDLNEALKEMDTRTSREALNDLARDAGKLGITGKEDLLQFVDGANQISVALGEDLGEDAIKTIGKMAEVYSRSSDILAEKDLKGKMLAVGSAVNELGASSTASESYLVQFAGRLGGVATQANISMDAILGFGSALDQDMQAVEMASTAFQKFIMKLMEDPAKFANLAGLEVGKFTQLLKTDANAAIKEVLRSLNEKGGFQNLIPVFKDMGLDGARAVGVLSSMASSIDKIDTAQEIANKAMVDGVSVTNEYNIKNNNLQAQLEKAKKEFLETSLALGEKLNPMLLKSTKGTTYLIKGLMQLPTWLKNNKTEIIALITVWSAYLILKNKVNIAEAYHLTVTKLAVTWHKLESGAIAAKNVVVYASSVAYNKMTGNVTRAAAAQKALKLAMASTPWGLIAAGITSVIVGLSVLASKTKEVKLKQSTIDTINKTASDRYAEQASKINMLNKQLHSESISLEQRRIALNKLQEIIPNYHASLTDEGKLINDNKNAIDEYLISLQNQIKMEAAKEELTSIYKDYYKQQKEINDSKKKQDDYLNQLGNMGATEEQISAQKKVYDLANKALKERLNLTKKEISEIESQFLDVVSSGKTPNTDNNNNDSSITQSTGNDNKSNEIDTWIAKMKATYMASYASGLIDKKEYDEKMFEAETEAIQKRLELVDEGTKEYYDLQSQAYQKVVDKNKKQSENELKIIADKYKKESSVVTQHYLDGQIDAKTYQERLKALEYEELKERVTCYKEGSEEYKKAEQDVTNWLQTDQLERRKSFEQELANYRKRFSKQTSEELCNQELEAFEKLCENIEIAEEEKQKIIAAIKKEYEEDPNKKWEIPEKYIKTFQFFEQQASAIMSATTTLINADTDAQIAKVEERYAAEIKAAGNNSKKVEQLEQEQADEISKIRAEETDKNFGIQITQAIASTAMSALLAYNAGLAAGGPAGLIMGPLASAMAIAAGGIQVAAIVKQREAAKANYWSGGYTPDGDWNTPQGTVHSGEFVANRFAVGNGEVRPVLDLINTAQRNNTVGSLKAQDISRVLAAPSAATTATTKQDSSYQIAMVTVSKAVDKLNTTLEKGIKSTVAITGDDGFESQMKRYNQLKSNKSRS